MHLPVLHYIPLCCTVVESVERLEVWKRYDAYSRTSGFLSRIPDTDPAYRVKNPGVRVKNPGVRGRNPPEKDLSILIYYWLATYPRLLYALYPQTSPTQLIFKEGIS